MAHVSRVLSLSLLLLPPAVGIPTAQAVTIDAFTDPYPPNPDLPVSGREIVFVGTTCDGGACPPGAIINHTPTDQSSQVGLPGVLGGERDALITQTTGTANSVIVQGYFTHNHNAGAASTLEVRYGVTNDLDADLTYAGADAMVIDLISGDMYSGPRPVPVTITVTTSSQQSMINDGIYLFPFIAFAGVDFTDIDKISYFFDASAHTSVDYALGPFRTNEPPVQINQTTWGRTKAIYR